MVQKKIRMSKTQRDKCPGMGKDDAGAVVYIELGCTLVSAICTGRFCIPKGSRGGKLQDREEAGILKNKFEWLH